MTYRPSDLPSKDCYSQPEPRLNQQFSRCESTDGGCPVLEESGTVCGETNSLSIFQEFRQIYDECLRKLEGSHDGSSTLKKLAPFRKLVEDLWEQNTMLVETVEELEQEATCRVTNLQDKLNKSCQKELHCMLKTKEREVEHLAKELSEKDEQIRNYCCQVEELKKDIKAKNKKYKELLCQLKSATRKSCSQPCESGIEEGLDDCDGSEVEELMKTFLKDIDEQKARLERQYHNAECQIKTLTSEKKTFLKERNEIVNKLHLISIENEKLSKEFGDQKIHDCEREELLKNIEKLNLEKLELVEKINHLQGNIKELNDNFKETRWALTSEVAEKHDQVQELRRCVSVLEEQLRQADMQTHFKDNIIKELRKELKSSKKSERRGLYDVVNEVRGKKKNDKGSNVTFEVECSKSGMTSHSSGIKCPEYYSASSICDDKDVTADTGFPGTSESSKLLSQVECLKSDLMLRISQLKEQKEMTRDLKEELTRTKMDLADLQEKYERQERRCKSMAISSVSEPGLNWHYTTLSCAVNKVEEALRSLSTKHSCGLSNCKNVIDEEMEKIRSVKNELKGFEINKGNNSSGIRCGERSSKRSDETYSCVDCTSRNRLSKEKCNLVHVDDIEMFREKAVTGLVALEQMREQINVLENLIKKYVEEFPCECDKDQVKSCEEKLEDLHVEFDEATEQLCCILEKISKTKSEPSCVSIQTYSETNRSECANTQTTFTLESTNSLKTESMRLQKEICDLENEAEKFKILSKQLEDEVYLKKNKLCQLGRELEEKFCEILKLRETIKSVGKKLKQMQCGKEILSESCMDSADVDSTDLKSLFCDLQEFRCILDKAEEALLEGPRKLKEDNEKLKKKLTCLEKCVCNKEETLKVLQDTVKLRECQIEELNSKMQTSECQSTKLAQDVEEKCRLIANLQEAVRKCKQFEVNVRAPQVESLEFEVCELDGKLKKSEKEILLREQKLESLHNEITNVSSKNFLLVQELKIMEPRLKSLYKTCHLFEKMVSELQGELSNKEREIEDLYEKIKELENELEEEIKRSESKAEEDAKCIQELSLSLKNFQNELCCNQERYMSVAETELKLIKEREKAERREAELSCTICELKEELKELQNQLHERECDDTNSNRIRDLECIIQQSESRQQAYEMKIAELQKGLDCTAMKHEEERKNMMQKLCEEKKENLKNKTLITKLNENIKQKTINERTLKEYIEQCVEDIHALKTEIQECKTEIEARKKIMCAMEKNDEPNLLDIEELICHLKVQKSELKTKCNTLKTELDKEVKLKKLLEYRVEDLNTMLEAKLQDFNQMVDNYKCTSSKMQQTLATMKEVEESLISSENELRQNLSIARNMDERECLKKLLNIKTAENAHLMGRLQILEVEMESMQTENAVMEANKDSVISQLRHEANCLENDVQDLQGKFQKLCEENKRLQNEMDCLAEKESSMQMEFRERQKELCAELRATICEKNDLLQSLDNLQKQLEQICLANVNKEKLNRELSEECSRLKNNNEANDIQLKNKSDKIICNLSKEIKNLNCELSKIKVSYNNLNEEYQSLLDEFKCCEKKKSNLEKLLAEIRTENQELQVLRQNNERELCELKTQNKFLKDKLSSKSDESKNSEEKKRLCEKIKYLTVKIKTLENRVIPDLEQEITEKNCCIENLKSELREANISSQRMRNEALRVVQYTKKYLAAQRCANETLKSRLECSNKRGNILGAENRDLEEQLKAVTRMNEFLLCQFESKNEINDSEPRSFSPLPWGCSTVERDTSSSEYLAESGIQSMQPSPTNMDYSYDYKQDPKRINSQWNSMKRNKCGGSIECPPCRSGVR